MIEADDDEMRFLTPRVRSFRTFPPRRYDATTFPAHNDSRHH